MAPAVRKSADSTSGGPGPSIPMTGRMATIGIVALMFVPVVAVIIGLAWWFAAHP